MSEPTDSSNTELIKRLRTLATCAGWMDVNPFAEAADALTALEALLAECESAIERWHYSPDTDSFAALVAILDRLKARA